MKIIDSILTQSAAIAAVRRDIHAHPELCFQEVRTADVVAANEDRLVVPGEPDLLWPGQVLVVPAPPALPHHSVG